MNSNAAARDEMVRSQIETRGIRDRAVLHAMRTVPREQFVAEELAEFAFDDAPLPIEVGQTISQPYIVAAMTAALDLQPTDRVLEVGTGSGYAAAVLSRIAAVVYTVERHEELATLAARRCQQLGYDNVYVRHGDGTLGWSEHAPYDAIIVAAAGPDVPEPLVDQLAIGGRLVIPIGDTPREQHLVRVTRLAHREFTRDNLGGVRFVPLVGQKGWSSDEEDAVERRQPPIAPERRAPRAFGCKGSSKRVSLQAPSTGAPQRSARGRLRRWST